MPKPILRLAKLDPYPDFSGMKNVPEYVKFWSKVDKHVAYPCWIWLAKQHRQYGVFKEGIAAHRWAWEERNGKIPPGLVIDHLCNNPPCVNPAHMRVTTHKENRARVTKITHCKNGHEFTPENTYQARGQRVCRACHRDWSSQQRAKRKGKQVMRIRPYKETNRG